MNQRHRAKKTSRNYLINLLQRVDKSYLLCLHFVSLPPDLFQSLMKHREQSFIVSGISVPWWKTFQIMWIVSQSLFIRKQFYFSHLGEYCSWAGSVSNAFYFFSSWPFFFNLCIKSRGTFLQAVLSFFFSVLKTSSTTEGIHISSFLVWDFFFSEWLGILKSRNQTKGAFSLEANAICIFSRIHVLVDLVSLPRRMRELPTETPSDTAT